MTSYSYAGGLKNIWIIVGKLVKPALGHIRGDMVMVPSPHGPLYFHRPQWHEKKEDAEMVAIRKIGVNG